MGPNWNSPIRLIGYVKDFDAIKQHEMCQKAGFEVWIFTLSCACLLRQADAAEAASDILEAPLASEPDDNTDSIVDS